MNADLANILDSDLFWKNVFRVPRKNEMHEQNQVLRVYHALMRHSVPDYEISLETQFQFAKGNTENGKRKPDICIFDPTINGKFNLYMGGKVAQSGDALKLSKLQRPIEVKVSPSIRDALNDIKKLADWRSQLNSKASE
jgi:hypothetical protein